MTNSDRKPLIGPDGEVREITKEDMKHAFRGRPPLPSEKKKRRINVMLDPDVIDALRLAEGSTSARVNKLLRKDLQLP